MRTLLSAVLLLPALIVSAGEPLTMLTWNIRYQNGHDREDRWELRREALAKEVLHHRPQVVGLQEALHEQLGYLRAQWPGYGCFGVGRDDGRESGEYAPVLWDTARFALINGRTVWLSPTPDRPSMGWDATCKRILTLVGLRDLKTTDTVWVANTHWDHVGSEAREHSARMAVELLRPLMQAGQAVVLMGDLNASPRQAPVRSLAAHFEDAALHHGRRATFNGFKRLRLFGRRIDYIWLAPGHWSVDHCIVPHPKVNGRHASDHFPVVAVLRPPTGEGSH
jgi:endonuclease/exonuclease/phosphatase family metal-dependent hydrolase